MQTVTHTRGKKQLKSVIEHGESLMFFEMFRIVFHIFTHLQIQRISVVEVERGKDVEID